MSDTPSSEGAPGTWLDADLMPDCGWPTDEDLAAVLEAGPDAFERALAADQQALRDAVDPALLAEWAAEDALACAELDDAFDAPGAARAGSDPSAGTDSSAGAATAPELDEVAALRAARLAADVPLAAPGLRVGPSRSALAGPLDQLEAALDAVAAAGASGSRADTERALRLSERLRALGLRELAEMDALGTHTTAGGIKRSTTTWLRDTLYLSDAAARTAVRTATDLRDRLPRLGAAVLDGSATVEGAKAVLSGTRGLDPDVVTDSEEDLITLARHRDPVTVHKLLRERAIAVSDKLAREAERRAAERAGFTHKQVGDAYVSHGNHTAENGATIDTWLTLAVERYRRDGDTRPKAQLQEQALLELALQGLHQHADANSEANDIHTTRSHLLIGVTPAQLAAAAQLNDQHTEPNQHGEHGEQLTFGQALTEHLRDLGLTDEPLTPEPDTEPDAEHLRDLVLTDEPVVPEPVTPKPDPEPVNTNPEPVDGGDPAPSPAQPPCPDPGVTLPLSPQLLNTGTTLSLGALRRLACDSLVQLVLLKDNTSGRLDPLHLSRTARTINGALFTYLVLRDKSCTVLGCHAPPALCEGHHVQHWLNGGPTEPWNLILLCKKHHHDHHDRGLDLPHRDGQRWITQNGWAWPTDHGWSYTDPSTRAGPHPPRS